MFEAQWALVAALLVQPAPELGQASAADRVQASSPATQTQTQAPAPAAAERWPDDKPFRRLFSNLGTDFSHLVTPNTAIIFGVGTGATIALHPLDDDFAQWADDAGPSDYTVIGRVFGDGWVQSGAAVATYAVGKVTHHPQVAHVGSDLIRAQLLNGILTGVIKAAANRERPSGGSHGMPSGHTSATFASATILHRHYGWKVGVPSYAVAGFVGWTRIRDHVHWLSDVAFGATIGIVAGRAVAATHHGKSVTVSATPTKGGFAVTATILK